MQKLSPPPLPDWIQQMLPAGIERYRLKVGEQHLHIMEIGQGYPVLLQHGNPTWGFLYRDIVRQLPPNQFRCIMPDLVGLGFSDKPRDGRFHTLQQHADWIHGVITQLGLEKLLFVGQDWGGPIGLHALSRNPSLMQGLVLLNTMARPPKPNFRPTAFHRFSRVPVISELVFRVFGYPQGWLHIAQGDPESIKGSVAKAYRYPLKGFKNNLAPLALARMVPNNHTHPSVKPLGEVEQYLKSFDGPASVIWGLKDPVLGRAMSAHTKLLPQAEAIKTQAGHFIQEEEADTIAKAILKVYQKASTQIT